MIRTYKARLEDLRDSILDSLWLRPVLWLLSLSALASLLITWEWFASNADGWTGWPVWFVVGGQGARTMLGAIAGATLTVVSLAFSLMMVVVIQTANAYTPRLLRHYIGDPHNHHVLGLLMGSFSYSLLVLRSVGEEPEFVPHLAVNVALVLSILSIFALLSFIHHVARSIEVGNIIGMIEAQTMAVLGRNLRDDLGRAYEGPDVAFEGARLSVRAESSGYVRRYDHEALDSLIDASDVSIVFEQPVGAYVLQGEPLATITSAEPLEDDDPCHAQVLGVVLLGAERSRTQDTRYGFEQLTDIALRALSPGINDPTTGIMALNTLLDLISRWVESSRPSHLRADEEGTLRVVFPQDRIDSLVHESIWPLIDYGAGDYKMLRRLISGVGLLASRVEGADRAPLVEVLDELSRQVSQGDWAPAQRAMLERELVDWLDATSRPSSADARAGEPA